MKWIKKIVLGILSFLLMDFIILLVISVHLKGILVDGIMKETIISQVSKSSVNDNQYVITEETINQITEDEKIRELLGTKEVQDLMNKYLDLTIDSLIDEEQIDQIEIEEDIINYLRDNKETVEKIVGQEITEEALIQTENEIKEKEFNVVYKQNLKNASSQLSTQEVTLLKGYKKVVSKSFQMIILSLAIIDLLLIALIQKSWYMWIKTFGSSLVSSGISLIVMSIVFQIVLQRAANNSQIMVYSLLKSSLIVLGCGIVIVFVYQFFEKKVKRSDNRDLS